MSSSSVLLLWLVLAQTPDARGEVQVAQPVYNGIQAFVPIPPEYHIRNEEGTPSGGLCVPSSIICNGWWQGVPDLIGGKASKLWKVAKSRWGGYAPKRLKDLLDEVMPGEDWAQYYGPDDAQLEKLTRAGYPLGVTMNTGHNYGYKPIAHMVSLLHYERNGLACFVDNNFPEIYSWVPAAEFKRRWMDQGEGWAVVWLRKPTVGVSRLPLSWLAALTALAVAALSRRRRVAAVA